MLRVSEGLSRPDTVSAREVLPPAVVVCVCVCVCVYIDSTDGAVFCVSRVVVSEREKETCCSPEPVAYGANYRQLSTPQPADETRVAHAQL